jgi:hypothetical protein
MCGGRPAARAIGRRAGGEKHGPRFGRAQPAIRQFFEDLAEIGPLYISAAAQLPRAVVGERKW